MAIKGKIVWNLEVRPLEVIKAADFSASGSKFVDTYIKSTEAFSVPLEDSPPSTVEIEYAETGGSDDGYLNGDPFYVSVTSTSSNAITGMTDIDFLYIKHTGYQYSSSSALSTTANSADYIEIRTASASGTIIAMLKTGQSIVLPFTGGGSGVDSGDFYFKSVSASLLSGGNTIAMEFICVKD